MPDRDDKTSLPNSFHEQIKARSSKRSRTLARGAELETTQPVPRNDLFPRLRLEDRPTTSLSVNARRVRAFDDNDVEEAVGVIQSLGWAKPIIIDEEGNVIDGELRLEAARRLQLQTVPCLVLASHTPAERRQLRLALNRLGQRREWDMDELKIELEELLLSDISIDNLGFDDSELDQILLESSSGPPSVDMTMDAPRVVEPGDVWILGSHRLICGDARDPAVYKALMLDERAQLVLTDPPWNIEVSKIVSTKHAEFAHASGEMSDAEFERFLADFISCCFDRMVDGAIAFFFIDWRQEARLVRVACDQGLEQINTIIWKKANAGMGSLYRSQHEMVPMFKKEGEHKNRIMLGAKGRNRSNVWEYAGAGTQGSDARKMLKKHPTSKPVAMLADAIIDVTDRDDIVLDCFGGSGSTLMAAEETGRIARVIELDPKYCDVILERWQGTTHNMAILEKDGASYYEVLERRQNFAGPQLETLPPPEVAPGDA